ncbi:unnamed protein product, partial [marine sediment metagenome]
ILFVRQKYALVASGLFDGGDNVLDRHAESCYQPGAAAWRFRQLEVVGISADGNADGVYLRKALASVEGVDRY